MEGSFKNLGTLPGCRQFWFVFVVVVLAWGGEHGDASLPHTCPRGCSCQVRDFEPPQTNCSFLGQAAAQSALPHIAAGTRFLYLKGNNLTFIPNMPFVHVKSLNSLNLDHNSLRDVHAVMENLSERIKTQLLSIHLSGNHIIEVPRDALVDLKALQSLYLKNNQIQGIVEGNFMHVNKLRTLYLSGNNLKVLPSGCLNNLTRLHNLFLNNNSLAIISPGVFRTTPNLVELDLSHNMLHVGLKTGVFSGLENLEVLKLDGNGLSSLPSQLLRGAPNIKELRLQHNRLHKFPIRTLRSLNRLKLLFLSNNFIERIPTELNLIHSLHYLYISHNRIHTVEPQCLVNLMNLSALWLDSNDIQSLTSDLLDRFRHMEYGQLSLAGNPLECDCRLVWLARWIRHREPPQYVSAIPTCSAPAELEDYMPFRCGQGGMGLNIRAQCSLAKGDACSGDAPRDSCLCGSKNTCYICPSGSFGTHSADGRQECLSCPAFSTSAPGARARAQCECEPGYTGRNGGNCTACPKSFYKNTAGDGSCMPCAPGSVTPYEASEYCDCQPGFTLMEDGGCQACRENTYKVHPGPLPCSTCPPHSRSPAGSNSSSMCECMHGAFRQVTNRKYGKCQEFPNQEQIAMGLLPAPSEYKSSLPPSNYMDGKSEVGIVLGALGSVVSVLAVVIFSVIYSRRVKLQKQEKQAPESEPIAEDLHRVHSMLNMYVSNAMYQRYELSVGNRLSIGDLVGQGAFGQVHVGLAHGIEEDGVPCKVAVKTLRDNATPEEVEALKTELDQMVYVGQHPNIISLLGACTQKDMLVPLPCQPFIDWQMSHGLAGRLMIIMEYAEHGNLLQYLKSRMPTEGYQEAADGHRLRHESRGRTKRNIMLDKQLMSLVWQIAKGMAHLTHMKCVHRDLAARNVLLSEGMVAKVSDFGLAREVYESGYYFKSSKGRLPFKWMSPEALLCGHYTTRSDVWSFGVLLWEVATFGSTPYPGIPADQMYEMLKAGYRMKRPRHCPHKLYEVMLHCWHESPVDRPSFRELVDRFDKILQEAAQKEYLDMEDDTTYLLSPGTSQFHEPNLSSMGIYHDTRIDVHHPQHEGDTEEKDPGEGGEEREEDDSGHPCRTPPGHQRGSVASDCSTEAVIGSDCRVLSDLPSPGSGTQHEQPWNSDYLVEKQCSTSQGTSPSNTRLHNDPSDWESGSKDSGMDDTSIPEAQIQRPQSSTVVFVPVANTSSLEADIEPTLLQS